MENETLVNAGAEVTVEPQNTDGAAQTVDVATDTPEGNGQPQSKEENAAFAAMRRQYEQDLSTRDQRLSGLDSIAKAEGYHSIEDMLDAQKAAELGVTVDEYRKSQQETALQRQKDIFESPEYQKLKSEYDQLQNKTMEESVSRQMAADLTEVQKVFPEVKSLEELGEKYTQLIQTGLVDAVTAARVAMTSKPKAPPDIGPVGVQTPPPGGSYSKADVEYFDKHPEAIDKLSDAEFAKLRSAMGKM